MTNAPSRPSLFRTYSSTTSISQTNKPRLYIALYPRGGSSSSYTSSHSCDAYHWSLVVGPQTALRKDPGTRYHVAHSTSPIPSSSPRRPSTTTSSLLYEENDILTHLPASTTLIRITIAKVTNPERLTSLLRSIPIPDSSSSYTCLSFIKAAYHILITDRMGGGCLKSYVNADDWKDIERCARKYCKKKRDQRRFTDAHGPWDLGCVSTFNYWENRETTP